MSYYCPVCNGMETLSGGCPMCGHAADDQGKLSDFYDPYSPYRQIDELRLTNGFDDLLRHVCQHWMYCLHCRHAFSQAVEERRA